MSKTARSWEMVTLLCIIFTYLSYTYKSRVRFRGTVVCVLTGALALYTHFIALVYIGGVLIAVFWTERGSGDLRFLKGLTLGLFLLFLPWLAVVFPFQMMIKASLPQEHLRYLWADHGLTTLLSVMNPGGYNPLDHIRHAVGMRYECGVAISVLSVCIILGRIRTCLKYDFMRFILVQTAAMLLLLLISPVPLCNQRTMIIFMPGLIILLAVCLTDLMTSGAPAYRIGAALFATCFITLSLIGFPFRSERSTLTEACRFLSPHMEDSKTPVILVSPPHLLATLQYMKAHESVNLENTAVSPYRAVVLLDPYWKALNTTILPLPPPSCPSWRSGTHNEHGLVWTMNDFFRENQGVSEVFYIREGSGNLFGCRFPGEVRMWDYDRSAAFTMTAMHRFGKIAVYHLKRKPEHLPPRRTSI